MNTLTVRQEQYESRYRSLAEKKFRKSAARLAREGWVPVGTAWTERQPGCLNQLLTLGLVNLTGYGGVLTVTYSRNPLTHPYASRL